MTGSKEISCVTLFLVPAAASNFTADHRNSTAVLLSWQRPKGDLDALAVAVSTSNGTSLWETTLPPDATELVVDQLTPGSAYRVAVTSKSGKLTNQSEISVRTGEVFSFSVCFYCVLLLLFLFTVSSSRLQLRQRRPSSP